MLPVFYGLLEKMYNPAPMANLYAIVKELEQERDRIVKIFLLLVIIVMPALLAATKKKGFENIRYVFVEEHEIPETLTPENMMETAKTLTGVRDNLESLTCFRLAKSLKNADALLRVSVHVKAPPDRPPHEPNLPRFPIVKAKAYLFLGKDMRGKMLWSDQIENKFWFSRGTTDQERALLRNLNDAACKK